MGDEMRAKNPTDGHAIHYVANCHLNLLWFPDYRLFQRPMAMPYGSKCGIHSPLWITIEKRRVTCARCLKALKEWK